MHDNLARHKPPEPAKKENTMARPAKIDDQTALPFATFSSFVSFLDDLHEMGVLPNKINNGVFKPSYSGSGMNLIQRAFRQFGLTDDEGVPDEARLKPLVDPATRPAAMKALLEQKYAGLIALPLATAGPAEFNEWFVKAGMDATATRKAKAFFFSAARENGIEMHPTVAGKVSRRGAPRGKRKGKRANGDGDTTGQTPPVVPPTPPRQGDVLFHPSIDAFLRAARTITEGDRWTQTARDGFIAAFTNQLDLFLPVTGTTRQTPPRKRAEPVADDGAAES
jgi:hypothetical protein